MSPHVPDTIGRYEILGRIGRGGMGEVFRARDPRIGRQVAIKLLTVPDEGLRDRFRQEAQSVGNLAHRNIVTIFDYGEHDGQSYIVMEFVEGVTLSDQIHDGIPIPLLRKLEIMEELSAGLGYAHNKGIVHRDVKPANVMTDREGTVKILDFGIARVGNIAMTQAGMLLGTPNYMSPEQFQTGRVDRRSDIFSVGALFYELLTNRRAFPGDQVWEVMRAVVSGTPKPVAELCPGIDPAVEATVNRALEKDPANRYQTLAEMSADLAEAKSRLSAGVALPLNLPLPPPGEPPPSTPRSNSGRALIAKRRAERIEGCLLDARRAFDAGDYTRAIDACEQAAMVDPDDPRALDLLDRARTALDDMKADELLVQGEVLLQRGELNLADQLIAEALQLAPHSINGARLRRDLADAKERQHQERRAHAERERRAREAAEAERRRVEQEHWLADRLAAAQKAIGSRHFNDAIGMLEETMKIRPDAAVADMLATARRSQAELDAAVSRQRECADHLTRARALLDGGQPEAALVLIDRVVELMPSDEEALQLRGKASAALGRLRAEARDKARREEEARQERLRRQKIADERGPATIKGSVAPAAVAPTPVTRVPAAPTAAPPSPVNRPEARPERTRILVAIGLAATAIVAIAFVWRLTRPAPTTVTNVSAPGPQVTAPPTSQPPPPTLGPSPPKPVDDPAAAIRSQVRAAIAKGDEQQALVALTEGLRITPNDPELTARLGDMSRSAETSATGARAQAMAAGAPKLAKADYDQGVGRLAEGARLRKTQQAAAIKKFWEAIDLFGKASTRAASAETAPPIGGGISSTPQPPPQPIGPVQNPPPVEGRGTTSPPLPPPPTEATAEEKEAAAKLVTARQLAIDRQAIDQVLDQYVNAYNSLDAGAVSRMVPGQNATVLSSTFSQYRSLRVGLADKQTTVQGDSATVVCSRQLDVVLKRGGQSQNQRSTATFVLRRSGSSWMIDSVTIPPVKK